MAVFTRAYWTLFLGHFSVLIFETNVYVGVTQCDMNFEKYVWNDKNEIITRIGIKDNSLKVQITKKQKPNYHPAKCLIQTES